MFSFLEATDATKFHQCQLFIVRSMRQKSWHQ